MLNINRSKGGIILLVAILFISLGCKKEYITTNNTISKDTKAKIVKPSPNEVEKINDINFFKNIRLGAHENPDYNGCLDVIEGVTYDVVEAGSYQERIDLTIVNGSSSLMNIITPASSRYNAWGAKNIMRAYIYDKWWIRNRGILVKLNDPTPIEEAHFINAESVDDLIEGFNEVSDSVAFRPGYTLNNNGPGYNVRKVEDGDLVFFHSEDRNVVAIIKVVAVIPGNDGAIRLQVKSGTF